MATPQKLSFINTFYFWVNFWQSQAFVVIFTDKLNEKSFLLFQFTSLRFITDVEVFFFAGGFRVSSANFKVKAPNFYIIASLWSRSCVNGLLKAVEVSNECIRTNYTFKILYFSCTTKKRKCANNGCLVSRDFNLGLKIFLQLRQEASSNLSFAAVRECAWKRRRDLFDFDFSRSKIFEFCFACRKKYTRVESPINRRLHVLLFEPQAKSSIEKMAPKLTRLRQVSARSHFLASQVDVVRMSSGEKFDNDEGIQSMVVLWGEGGE